MMENASEFGKADWTDFASEAFRLRAKTSYHECDIRSSSLEKWNASEENEARRTAGTTKADTTGNAGLPGDTAKRTASAKAKSSLRIFLNIDAETRIAP